MSFFVIGNARFSPFLSICRGYLSILLITRTLKVHGNGLPFFFLMCKDFTRENICVRATSKTAKSFLRNPKSHPEKRRGREDEVDVCVLGCCAV